MLLLLGYSLVASAWPDRQPPIIVYKHPQIQSPTQFENEIAVSRFHCCIYATNLDYPTNNINAKEPSSRQKLWAPTLELWLQVLPPQRATF